MEEKDERSYQPAIDAGELIVVPADAVLDEWLYDWCKVEFAKYNIKRICADDYKSAYLLERWKLDGHNPETLKQSANTKISPVIEELRRRIVQKRILHRRNALVSWQLSCARCITTAQDVFKIVKQNSRRNGKGGIGHIDSIDALINALAARRADEIAEATTGNGPGIYISKG
jgi:phage terminase large subunit-like protein